MGRLRRTGLAVLAIMAVFLTVTSVGFLVWRAAIERRLLAESHIVRTSRGFVEYADRGDGPTVLLLHGTPGGYDQVLGFVAAGAFAKAKVRYIMPSRPGYLRTPLSSGKTPADQARLFAALLARLGIKKVIVIGASGGGPSALEFALLYPDMCSALVLEEAVTQRIVVEDNRVPPLVVDFILFAVREAMRWTRPPNTHEGQIVASLQAAQIESLVPYGARIAGQSNDYYQYAHMAPLPLEKITCPTLILHGTADHVVPIAHPEHAHASIAGSELVELPGADHGMVVQRHAELERLIGDFIAKHA